MKWLFRRNIENPSVPLNKALDILTSGTPSATGISINHQTALSNASLWRAVNLISSSVAKLPLIAYKRDGDSRARATQHPAYRLVKAQPNPTTTAYNFWRTLVYHGLICGNGYFACLRNEFGNPQELYILDPTETYPVRENGILKYVTQLDGKPVKLSASDVGHIMGLGFDGFVGYSVVDLLRDTISHGIAVQRYSSHFFKNSAKPHIAIELPPNLRDPEKIEQYRKAWNNIHSGIDGAWRPALMVAGSKIHTMGTSQVENELHQNKQFDLIQISNITGIPASKLGSQNNTSYSSLEAEAKAFLAEGLDPWLVNIEQTCNQVLLSERQKALDTHFFEYMRKAIIQIDAATESSLLVNEVNNGLISWQEARRIRNLSTDKDEAEEWRRPANIILEGGEPEPQPLREPQEPEGEPQEPDEAQEPEEQEEAPDATERALQALTEATLKRLIKRLAKSVEGGATDLSKHRSIMIDSLRALPRAEQFTDDLLQSLREELEAVLPEQRSEIFNRLDTSRLYEDLWK